MAKSRCLVHWRWEIIAVSDQPHDLLARCQDCGHQQWLDTTGWHRPVPPRRRTVPENRQVIVPMLAVINHCAELQLCPQLRMKRFKVAETKIKRPVTLEWINAFRANADRPDMEVLALFLFATGARITEALSVRWIDIDFARRSVLIRHQTKPGNERRAHLLMDLFVALCQSPARSRTLLAIAYTTARDALGGPHCKGGLSIEPLTFHSCRHGFATALHDKRCGG